MAYVQPASISDILSSLAQLGQSRALVRQRRDAEDAARASTAGAIGSIAGGIAAGVLSSGNPYAAAAGAAAGSRLLGGDKVSGSQTISQAGQAYQMAQSQQAYDQAQADRAAVGRAGDYLNPPPQVQSSSINTPGQIIDSPDQAQPVQTPAMSRGDMTITQQQPNVRGAIGELFKAGQVGPAISLMASQQKQGGTMITKEIVKDGKTYYQQFQEHPTQGLIPVGQPSLKQAGSSKGQDDPYFPGTGLDTSATRNINNIAPKIKAGTASPEEIAAYTTSWNQLTTPSVFQDAAGNQMVRPAKDLSRFPAPPTPNAPASGGQGAAISPQSGGQATGGGYPMGTVKVDNKPFTPEQAAKVAMINSAIKTHQIASQALLTPDGTGFDWQKIATMNANVPFTEGRVIRQQFKDAIEARLRAESGAAVPDSEVDRAMERFMPSTLDSNASIKSKLQRFDEWLKDTSWMIQEGRAPKPAGAGDGGVQAIETPDDAAKLKPGTRYKTPDGRIFVR